MLNWAHCTHQRDIKCTYTALDDTLFHSGECGQIHVLQRPFSAPFHDLSVCIFVQLRLAPVTSALGTRKRRAPDVW